VKLIWLERAYWTVWCLTVVLTGILSGYMVSHSIMLGRFFNWFIETDNLDLLSRTYSQFRASGNAYRVYDIPFGLHLIFGTVLALLALVIGRHRLLSLLAGLSTWLVSAIFIGFDVGGAEDAVLTSTADSDRIEHFLAVNIPVHTLFAGIYLSSMLGLILIVMAELRHERRTNRADRLPNRQVDPRRLRADAP